jgi:2-polyprenyl-3-methyl-5-hydroxy-6-metoxy-1,4-benzoquinol methylase
VTAPDDVGRYFDREAIGWSRRYRKSGHFLARLGLALGWIDGQANGLRLLDYGCGSGVLARELALLGHEVTAIDISAGMIAAARENFAGLPAPPRLEQTGDGLPNEWLQDEYDGVISLGVLEYVEQPYAILETLSTRIAPGGFLMVSVPNQLSLLRRVEQFVFRHPRPFRRLRLFRHLTGPDTYLRHQKKQFAQQALSEFLANLKFETVLVRYHVAPRLLKSLESSALVGMTMFGVYRKERRTAVQDAASR